MALHPIWKDYLVDLGNAESTEYIIGYIQDGFNNTIYRGRAWKRPNEDNITICINDICEDWLINEFPSLVSGFNQEQMPVMFSVQTISEAGVYAQVADVRFVQDWSYDNTHDAEKDGVASPINGVLDRRQYLLWTGLDVAIVNVVITKANGEQVRETISLGAFGDFSNDFSRDFAASLASAGSGTLVRPITRWDDAVKVSVNGVQYDVVDSCARYVLYYRNAFGGWDSLLADGRATEEDAVTRHSMEKTGAFNRQTTNYLNEIQKRLTLRTTWLSDEQSMRMHHLLNSTDVYLHDLVTNEIHPVVLDNSSTPYKTYKGEGRGVVSYDINAVIAQSRKRR